MDILVAIVVIGLLAIVAYLVLQRRRGDGLGRFPTRRRDPRDPRFTPSDPMQAAVVDHMRTTDPKDIPAAEQRLRAEARRVAAPLQAEAMRVEQQRAADQMANGDVYADDPRIDDTLEPRPADDDPRYDGRSR